ncbi:MAG TPA: class I SAM-dependent methyltransferase [Chitinophagaceae bacterium]|jgi:Methylase involved in ubiquinone/menaquinone biosynthesis
MSFVQKTRQYFSHKIFPTRTTGPETAYDLWSEKYDHQPDNLMLALDEEIFSALLEGLNLQNKIIADIGCGTGRHWKKILEQHPKKLIGFDVSEGMLKILQQKFPQAETHHLISDELNNVENEYCDIIISTLTIAHIKDPKKALREWNRILKPGGEIIITDYHPAALAKGGNRTFRYQNKTIAVKNYVHPIETIKEIAAGLLLKVLCLNEKSIDEQVKSFYEKQNALPVFEAWKGTPIIYGIHLKKTDAAL